MNGPGTDQFLFENDDEENDEPEIEGNEWDDDGRDADDVAWDDAHAPTGDHPNY